MSHHDILSSDIMTYSFTKQIYTYWFTIYNNIITDKYNNYFDNNNKQLILIITKIKITIMNTINSKRFVIRKSLINKNTTINVEFKNGLKCTYNHDKVYEIMKDKLNTLPCFIKYNSYTSSTNVPVSVRSVVEVQ